MDIIGDNSKPIYMRIAAFLEDEILGGRIAEEERIYSQYQLADMFNINPATAAKGLNLLADAGILYKKRGLGMFVAEGARKAVAEKRKHDTFNRLVNQLVTESRRLGISGASLVAEIIKVYGSVDKNECN